MQPTAKTSTRSVPVFGQRLKELRKQRGWTQQELADRAGYCERLVRKAELGGCVSEETLQVLAQTLSESASLVTTWDLRKECSLVHVDLADALTSPGADGWKRLPNLFSFDCHIDFIRVQPALPISGLYKGSVQAADWYTAWYCLYEVLPWQTSDQILLCDQQHGFLHFLLSSDQNPEDHQAHELDLRFALKDGKVDSLVCLSSLDGMQRYLSLWEEALMRSYKEHLKILTGELHAEFSR